MTLDPQMAYIVAAFEPMAALDWSTLDADFIRRQLGQSMPPPFEVVLPDVRDIEIPTADGPMAARLYKPSIDPDLPVILYLHGGGFVVGSIDQYDLVARCLAKESKAAILSIGYRLAPEHPYPAAIEDSYAALEWLATKARHMGLNPHKIAVAGDSAGGTLATTVAYLAHQRGGPDLRHQLLIYPSTDTEHDTPSFRENDRYLLTPDMSRWYQRQYLGTRMHADRPLASPVRFPSLGGLAHATVITAEYDPLRDEGEIYGMMLARAGVPTQIVRVPGAIHGFMAMLGAVDAADHWLRHAAGRLKEALAA